MTFAEFGLAAFQAMLPYMATAGAGLVGWVGTQLGVWLRAHARGTASNAALDVLQHLVITVVTTIEQTVVEEAKKKAGGNLTLEDAKSIKQAAVDRIKGFYGPEGLALLAKALKVSQNSVTQLIGDKIETEVYHLKFPGQDGLPVFTSGPATPAPAPAAVAVAVATSPAP